MSDNALGDSTPRASYSDIAKALHWLIAGLIVLQYILGELAEDASSDLSALALWANHKSIGMTVLALAVIRLAWRLTHRPPALPNTMPGWQQRVSSLVHLAIYILIFALPISGWLMSSASAYSVSWFNLFAFPDLVAPSEALAERLESAHHLMAEGLFIIVVLHALAALKHHFIDRDDVMRRMLSTTALVLFAATLALGIPTLTAEPQRQAPSDIARPGAEGRTTEVAPDAIAFAAGTVAAWDVDYANSEIRFTGEQAGAEFTGVFDRWQGDIRFDPQNLTNSSAEVVIELASVNSQDSDRDDTARGSDWFDIDNTPTATFQATGFSAVDTGSGNAFLADGQLTIRGISADVQLTFTVEEGSGSTLLIGEAEIARLEMFNLGTGDWADTSWVGEQFAISVTVAATR